MEGPIETSNPTLHLQVGRQRPGRGSCPQSSSRARMESQDSRLPAEFLSFMNGLSTHPEEENGKSYKAAFGAKEGNATSQTCSDHLNVTRKVGVTDTQTAISSEEMSCHLWGKMSGAEHLEPGWSTKGREGRCTLQCLGQFWHQPPPPSGPDLLAMAGDSGSWLGWENTCFLTLFQSPPEGLGWGCCRVPSSAETPVC